MSSLSKVLEEARVLQLRNGVTAREALAMALAQQRRSGRAAGSNELHEGGEPLQIQMPAASCLDSMLPRDREPTIAEIREAWKECMEQTSLFGEAQR